MKGYKAKSHYMCIRKWVLDAVKRQNKQVTPIKNRMKGSYEREYDYDELARIGFEN